MAASPGFSTVSEDLLYLQDLQYLKGLGRLELASYRMAPSSEPRVHGRAG